MVAAAGAAYSVGLALFWLLAPTVGEANPTIALLLLMPPLLWLVPAALLFFPSVAFARRTALALVGVSLVHIVFFMDLEPGMSGGSASGKTLTVLSYNRGQHNNASLQPFKTATAPDIIALQDARHRARNYQRSEPYSDLPHVSQAGEYLVLSRFPVLSAEEIPFPDPPPPHLTSPHPASRFEIDVDGQTIVLYVTHFMTPRDWLNSVKRGGFLYGVIGLPGTPLAEKRRAYSRFWDLQRRAAETVASMASEESLPTLVVGDLNVVDTGSIYRVFSTAFTDAHESVGSGFGFTFPGKTRNPAALFGPWLRLDYVFADARWEAVDFVTEPDRPSQHRAIAATLTLLENSAEND